MDILIIIVLIIAAIVLFLVELFVIPGISIADMPAMLIHYTVRFHTGLHRLIDLVYAI